MKKITILLYSLISLCIVDSADCQIKFQKVITGTSHVLAYGVQQTTDGGYIIAGTAYNAQSNEDLYVVKTDAWGDTLWTKTFSGSDTQHCYSVEQTSDGGYILFGVTNSFIGNKDFFLLKLSSNGNVVWTKNLINEGGSWSSFARQTSDGGFILVGQTDSVGNTNDDIFLVKTDSAGTPLWQRVIGISTAHDYVSCVQQTYDGGFVLAASGRYFGPDLDFCLIKTNANGNVQWKKVYGGASSEGAVYVSQTSDSGYIMVGETYSFTPGETDIYLVRTDANGDTLWTRCYSGQNSDHGMYVAQTPDGGFIIGGHVYTFGSVGGDHYDFALIKTNSNGDTLWTRTYGDSQDDYGWSAQQTSDGGYVITGYSRSFGTGDNHIYLVKTDSLGNSGGCYEYGTVITSFRPPSQMGNPVIPAFITTTPWSNVSFTEGHTGIPATLCTSSSINETEYGTSFQVYPNPSSGDLFVLYDGISTNIKLEIYNALGISIYSGLLSNKSEKEIRFKNFPSGIYFVKVFDGEKSYCKKLIIEHD
ncbi:MAG TPA: T9SS type A sorting domain-containing protein [Bacteroidia bacterium]|nr:T9SS type A sorting domain-containing protein [Bacteroidia bacterium]